MSRAAGIVFALLLALGPVLPSAWAKGAGGGQALRPKLEGQALVDALKQGGHVILLRHTATEPVTPDPDLFDLSDCSTQRALSEKGRSQAVSMGKAFRKLGIPVGQVVGRIDQEISSKDVVYRFIDEFIDSVERLQGMLDAAD